MDYFEIPIAIFTFKRSDTVLHILNQIKKVNPKKLYIIGDYGRNKEENIIVKSVREQIQNELSTWNCEIIYDYAEKNRGVYENIGLGACRVFEKEKYAIFLEDDNLPSLSFFRYCQELLEKYQYNEQVLWICGTNYLEKMDLPNQESYVFTQQLLPCGWASWSSKFLKYYEKDFSSLNDETIKKIKSRYLNKNLFYQQLDNWNDELNRYNKGKKYFSWDYHMSYSLMYHNLYGISPAYNLIKNIGVDEYSEHGGSSFEDEMTKRFCGIEKYELTFPLKHPTNICINKEYEEKVSSIILFPFSQRIKKKLVKLIKKVLSIENDVPIFDYLKRK